MHKHFNALQFRERLYSCLNDAGITDYESKDGVKNFANLLGIPILIADSLINNINAPILRIVVPKVRSEINAFNKLNQKMTYFKIDITKASHFLKL